jgi:hypothetical protein
VGKTFRVPPSATDAERDEIRRQLEKELLAVTKD